MATLSVGTTWRSWALGMQWGLGHSAGLLIVAIVFLALGGKVDLRAVSHVLEPIVGVFMVLLGLWGVHRALQHYQKSHNADGSWSDKAREKAGASPPPTPHTDAGSDPESLQSDMRGRASSEAGATIEYEEERDGEASPFLARGDPGRDGTAAKAKGESRCRLSRAATRRLMAFVVGVIHIRALAPSRPSRLLRSCLHAVVLHSHPSLHMAWQGQVACWASCRQLPSISGGCLARTCSVFS